MVVRKKKAFRMRRKPKKPVNEKIRKNQHIDGWSVANLVIFLEDEEVDLITTEITVVDDGFGEEYYTAYLHYTGNQFSEKEWIRELKNYMKKLANYEKWEKEHEDEIIQAQKEKLSKEKQKREDEIMELEKRLKKLKEVQ